MLRGCPAQPAETRGSRARAVGAWRARAGHAISKARAPRAAPTAAEPPVPRLGPTPFPPGLRALPAEAEEGGRFPGTFQESASRGHSPGCRVKEAPEQQPQPPPQLGNAKRSCPPPDGGGALGPPLRALALCSLTRPGRPAEKRPGALTREATKHLFNTLG
ncbi:atherin-like [Antechinus flavipes]|uniref:atherin-like n=1 Tax=Antechinus flavipes TaxID=38775 RepID=UPI0022366F6F|nr:atherin-like [Antechinus flavipes]XP_051819635.1 atherin-like [Antechinus flavipes]